MYVVRLHHELMDGWRVNKKECISIYLAALKRDQFLAWKQVIVKSDDSTRVAAFTRARRARHMSCSYNALSFGHWSRITSIWLRSRLKVAWMWGWRRFGIQLRGPRPITVPLCPVVCRRNRWISRWIHGLGVCRVYLSSSRRCHRCVRKFVHGIKLYSLTMGR